MSDFLYVEQSVRLDLCLLCLCVCVYVCIPLSLRASAGRFSLGLNFNLSKLRSFYNTFPMSKYGQIENPTIH